MKGFRVMALVGFLDRSMRGYFYVRQVSTLIVEIFIITGYISIKDTCIALYAWSCKLGLISIAQVGTWALDIETKQNLYGTS